MPGTRKKSKNTLAPSDAVHPYNSDAPRKKKTKPGPAPAGTSKRLTARKSVGGLAPRVPIQPAFGDLSPSPSPAPSQSPGIGPTPANQHRTPTPMDIDEEEEGVPETPDLEGDVVRLFLSFKTCWLVVSTDCSGVACVLTEVVGWSSATAAKPPTASPAFQSWLRSPPRSSGRARTRVWLVHAPKIDFWYVLVRGCQLAGSEQVSRVFSRTATRCFQGE